MSGLLLLFVGAVWECRCGLGPRICRGLLVCGLVVGHSVMRGCGGGEFRLRCNSRGVVCGRLGTWLRGSVDRLCIGRDVV